MPQTAATDLTMEEKETPSNTFTECRKWMNWASVALTMEYKKILESKEEWLDDSLITGQKLRAQVWLINKFACMHVCVVQNVDILNFLE